MNKEIAISQKQIENRIYTIRGVQVMMDSDLAEMYQTENKYINRALKRNPDRFPEFFAYQLTNEEWKYLKFQSGTSSEHGGRRTPPYVFSEQGVAMLSAVLQTPVSIQVSIQIMNAFVQMRKLIGQSIIQQLRFKKIDNKLIEHDQKFDELFKALENNELPQKGIFYNGQVFDACTFTADLIRKAKQSIIVIDNYVNDSVLTLLSKRKNKVSATIYTKTIGKQLELDLKKHNSQYPEIHVLEFKDAHDRFLILYNKELYHFGASLKDLGKKWFAFSKMDCITNDILHKLPE